MNGDGMLIKYKVTDLKMRSIIVNPRSKLSVQYKKGKWVKALIGGLLVFKSEYAAKFFFCGTGFIIWECKVKNRINLPSMSPVEKLFLKFMRYLEKSWASPLAQLGEPWPLGTEAYEQVKLIEEIKNE